ncbi:MAG: leucyl/phenylalanyl-tRNA--protein transferase [Sulfurovum sp.]|nr:leucyl/phenylalanyl-tRNA--protein transferase [Sulfurovum sp.]
MASMFDEDHYLVPPLSLYAYVFPDPRNASDEGLLAFGGDLSISRVLTAYRKGIFPWYSDGDPILWWSPDPRLLLYPGSFKTSKSFARVLKSAKFSVSFDKDFSAVIKHCAAVPRGGQNGTWLNQEMQEVYQQMHAQGFAHSVEVWEGEALVGGLYGLAMGKVFFGESMFSLTSNASKVAFRALSDVLGGRGYDFIDCQMKTDHLIRLGAAEVRRDSYLDQLEVALAKPSDIGLWHAFEWKYKEC